MCVIAFSPRGKAAITADEIGAMWAHNPDGAGIMYDDGRVIHCHKGLMTLDDFRRAWTDVPSGAPVAAHFRIATHGGISPEMCHPFPLDPGKLSAIACKTDAAIMHNGIFPFCGSATESDTLVFARDVLSPIHAYVDIFSSSDARQAVETIVRGSRSRLLVMGGGGRHAMFGDWISAGSVYYSNRNHADPAPVWSAPAAWIDDGGGVVSLYGLPVYIECDDGELDDPDDYGLDADGNVCVYDWDDVDGCGYWIPCRGYRVLTSAGLPASYDRVLDML